MFGLIFVGSSVTLILISLIWASFKFKREKAVQERDYWISQYYELDRENQVLAEMDRRLTTRLINRFGADFQDYQIYRGLGFIPEANYHEDLLIEEEKPRFLGLRQDNDPVVGINLTENIVYRQSDIDRLERQREREHTQLNTKSNTPYYGKSKLASEMVLKKPEITEPDFFMAHELMSASIWEDPSIIDVEAQPVSNNLPVGQVGRPRKYENAAEKQKAYRERLKHRQQLGYTG